MLFSLNCTKFFGYCTLLGAIAAAQVGSGSAARADETFPPDDRSPPNQGSGTRPNPCLPDEPPLTPLALASENPVIAADHFDRWGYTEQAQPTLWAYIPYTRANTARLEVSLRTEANETVYETALTPPETAGIISIPLDQAPALMPGEWYQWYVLARVYCSDNLSERPRPDRARAWIQRRPIDPAQGGDWSYDRLQNAASDSNAWQPLLEALGYGAIADRPRLDCCQPKP